MWQTCGFYPVWLITANFPTQWWLPWMNCNAKFAFPSQQPENMWFSFWATWLPHHCWQWFSAETPSFTFLHCTGGSFHVTAVYLCPDENEIRMVPASKVLHFEKPNSIFQQQASLQETKMRCDNYCRPIHCKESSTAVNISSCHVPDTRVILIASRPSHVDDRKDRWNIRIETSGSLIQQT